MDIEITEITDGNHIINYDLGKYFYRGVGSKIWNELGGFIGCKISSICDAHNVKVGIHITKRFKTDKEYPFGY